MLWISHTLCSPSAAHRHEMLSYYTRDANWQNISSRKLLTGIDVNTVHIWQDISVCDRHVLAAIDAYLLQPMHGCNRKEARLNNVCSWKRIQQCWKESWIHQLISIIYGYKTPSKILSTPTGISRAGFKPIWQISSNRAPRRRGPRATPTIQDKFALSIEAACI